MNIKLDDPLDELCICLHVCSVSIPLFEVPVRISTVHDTVPSVPKHSSLYHSLKSLGSVSLVLHLLISRKCLYCDDIIYSDHLSFYLSFIQDSLYAGQDPLQIYKLSDLRFDLHDALTEHCVNYCKIHDSSRFSLHYTSLVVIGIKGLLDLGGTDAFNCILQCFLHLPFLVDFFLSGNHCSIVCLLPPFNASPASCTLPWTNRTSFAAFSAASASSSSASSATTTTRSAFPLLFSTAFGLNWQITLLICSASPRCDAFPPWTFATFFPAF